MNSKSYSLSQTSRSPPTSDPTSPDLHQQIDVLYRAESRRVFASLAGVFHDFDLAEEALHEAFAAALAT